MSMYIDIKVHSYGDVGRLLADARLCGELLIGLGTPEVMVDVHDVHLFVPADVIVRLLFPDDNVIALTDADIQAEHDAAADNAALEAEVSGSPWPR